jgi:hypothetical protein
LEETTTALGTAQHEEGELLILPRRDELSLIFLVGAVALAEAKVVLAEAHLGVPPRAVRPLASAIFE